MEKEYHECEQCGEINLITRDIKGNIVPEDCVFCPGKYARFYKLNK